MLTRASTVFAPIPSRRQIAAFVLRRHPNPGSGAAVPRPRQNGRVEQRFGNGTLQAGGRIFAMRNAGGLALKLPAARVAVLLAAGDGVPFDAGKGRPMKEWVVIPWQSDAEWLALAEEALVFAGATRKA